VTVLDRDPNGLSGAIAGTGRSQTFDDKRSLLTSIANERLAYSLYISRMAPIGGILPDLKKSILVVEDDESVRTSLGMVLSGLGHRVRSASDGLAALIAMRQEAPDILLSDLNMPRMSGFELLSVVRRRFPAVRVIAMSGAFAGDQIPYGVTADAFYPKGYGVAILIRTIESLALSKRQSRQIPEPIWVQRSGHDPKGAEFVTIACPDCLRTFAQVISGAASLISETSCIFCQSSIHYAVV
jgi:CheY-like chemotaxis protein